MSLKFIVITLFLASITVQAKENSTQPPGMDSYLNPKHLNHEGLNETLWQMLTDGGRTVGFRGGKAERAWELRQSLAARESSLDRMYAFAPLISRQGWLPPVIAAADSLATVTGDQIRTANKVYRILVPERFVSNPPTWRKYLYAGLTTKNDSPNIDVIPKNSKEKAVWKAAVEKGWQEGRESADKTLETNFNRLTRDYAGMVRYSTLLQQGMISPPVVTEHQQTVSGTRDELMLGDKVRDLKERAGFELDKKRWKPTITTH